MGDGLWQQGRWAIFGTLACLAVSLAYNYVAFRNFDADSFQRGMISATVLPVLLAGPLLYYLSLKLQELTSVRHRLGVISSTDSLTACLNRGAFTARVEANLINPSGRSSLPGGALLIVDADHFKRVNERFGLSEGDQALRLIAGAIRGSIRNSDLVGRLGGQEFGVFLGGATAENAADIAQRIRQAVAEAEFVPGGWPYALSVSIGGAVFTQTVEAGELFRVADQRLYEAKQAGRDRISLSTLPVVPASARTVASTAQGSRQRVGTGWSPR